MHLNAMFVDGGQIIVKAVLIAVLAVVAIVLVIPGKGARGQAIQRLALLLVLVLGALAVVFPEMTTRVANFLGIGRGVDLLFYASIVLFIGFALTVTGRIRRMDRELTVLARKIALLEANVREGHDTLDDPTLTGPIDIVATDREGTGPQPR